MRTWRAMLIGCVLGGAFQTSTAIAQNNSPDWEAGPTVAETIVGKDAEVLQSAKSISGIEPILQDLSAPASRANRIVPANRVTVFSENGQLGSVVFSLERAIPVGLSRVPAVYFDLFGSSRPAFITLRDYNIVGISIINSTGVLALNVNNQQVVEVETRTKTALEENALFINSTNSFERGDIVGGRIGFWFEVPWSAFLEIYTRSGIFDCTASRIRSNILLTAQHCVYDRDGWYNFIWASTGAANFYQGQWNYVDNTYRHTSYDPNSQTSAYDIAVSRVNGSLAGVSTNLATFANDISLLPVGTAVSAMGWGRTSANAPPADALLRITDGLTILPSSSCPTIRDSLIQICAGSSTGTDTCSGDSGGPLYRFSGAQAIQFGITSYGSPACNGSPAVYTRVSGFEAWITNVIALLQPTTTTSGNDNFANAATLQGDGTVTGSNVSATAETGEPAHAGYTARRSVWWRWTPTRNAVTTLSTAGSSFDTLLAVYRGSSLSSLVPVASNDDFGGTAQSSVTFTAQANTTYYIAVDGYGGSVGSIRLTLSTVPLTSRLTVSWGGTGRGTVQANGTSIDCGQVCSAIVDQGITYIVRALPLPGSVFTGWSGDCGGTAASTTISLSRDSSCQANFSRTANDFTGDGRADLVWRDLGSGQVYVWAVSAGRQAASYPGPTVGREAQWEIVGAADFNADAISDLIWRNTVSGETQVWQMNQGTRVFQGALRTSAPSEGWLMVGAADTNADGMADTLWRNTNTGETQISLSNGPAESSVAPLVTLDANVWQIEGFADFDSDGRADILWRDQRSGEAEIWFMNGTSRARSETVDRIDPNWGWRIIAAADFSGDQRADLLWQHTDGTLQVWVKVASGGFAKTTLSQNPGGTWEFIGAADTDLDARADIIWRNTATGNVNTWLMSGAQVRGAIDQIGTHPSAFEIATRFGSKPSPQQRQGQRRF